MPIGLDAAAALRHAQQAGSWCRIPLYVNESSTCVDALPQTSMQAEKVDSYRGQR